MPKTFSQINIHLVFSVKNRETLILAAIEEELRKYIAGIIRNKNQKLLAINSIPDHVHIFVSINPDICVADLVREIKKHSTDFINGKIYYPESFTGRKGMGRSHILILKYRLLPVILKIRKSIIK